MLVFKQRSQWDPCFCLTLSVLLFCRWPWSGCLRRYVSFIVWYFQQICFHVHIPYKSPYRDHPVFNDIERIMETAVLFVASTISPIIMLKQKGFSYNSNMALNYLGDIDRAHISSIRCSLNISSDEERIQKCDVLHWAKRTGNAAQDE